jgi:hypothetical protein
MRYTSPGEVIDRVHLFRFRPGLLRGASALGGGRFNSVREKDMDFTVGLAILLCAAALIYLGRPDGEGNSPRFLRFGAALVLYPPVILVVIAFGAAEVISSFS